MLHLCAAIRAEAKPLLNSREAARTLDVTLAA